MGNVFILDESKVPEAEKIQEVLSAHYHVAKLTDPEELKSDDPGRSQSVVIFSSPPEKIALQVTQLKTLLPTVACIAVCNEDQVKTIPGYQYDSDFLLTPLNSFEILSRVSTAMRQTELLTSIEESAQLDEVTLLYNRRYFLQRLYEEMSLAKRHMSPLAVVIIGINFFQGYLDSYGYDFVNGLIRTCATIVEDHKRNEDIIARIGDDEIGLLLPRSTEKGAKILASRIVESIGAVDLKCGDEAEEISVQAGIAGYPMADGDDKADADAVVRYARHALHNARCSTESPVEIFSEIKPVI